VGLGGAGRPRPRAIIGLVRRLHRRTWLSRTEGRKAAARLGQRQEQLVSRRQLIAAGVPRWLIRAEIQARRWRELPGQVIALHMGPLSPRAQRWAAVLATGRRAALDGVSALQAEGVTGLDEDLVHVIVPRGDDPPDLVGVRVHESRRYNEDDVIREGIPRLQPAVAAVHAALWAKTDRQAMLFLMVPVQQRKVTPEGLAEAMAVVRRHPRRRMLLSLIAEMAGGVRSLNELDVARDLRRRGLPEPDRQVIRRRPSGLEYLDCRFSAYDVVLEIDGAGHDAPEQRALDVLRDLAVAADGDTTVRVPAAAYRLAREQILDRLEALFVARGWRRPAA
jgi:very-short-patch-repair endonuclease